MKLRWRRIGMVSIGLIALGLAILQASPPPEQVPVPAAQTSDSSFQAMTLLNQLPVKGRAPKTGYSRDQFGNGWATINGCDTRQIILYRDLADPVVEDGCIVVSGKLQDPYTGNLLMFTKSDSALIQIDHVVALSDAWQKGAQNLSRERRIQLANDPLELLAVEGRANQQKGDGDAATWLPSNKGFRCEYVARQLAVKHKYDLWLTSAEKTAIETILTTCPLEALPVK